jgi:DNA-binding MarR family transcriptional regulator
MAEQRHDRLLERRLRMSRTIDDPALRALLNLQVATAHLVEELEAVVETEGISLAAYNVLRILRGSPDGLPRNAIHDRLVYRKADVTRIIDRLEARGFAERARAKEDRRLSIARVSAKGLKVLARLDPKMDASIDIVRRRLPERDLVVLNRLLEQLYAEKVE